MKKKINQILKTNGIKTVSKQKSVYGGNVLKLHEELMPNKYGIAEKNASPINYLLIDVEKQKGNPDRISQFVYLPITIKTNGALDFEAQDLENAIAEYLEYLELYYI